MLCTWTLNAWVGMRKNYDEYQMTEIEELTPPNFHCKGFIAKTRQVLATISFVRRLAEFCGFGVVLCHVNEGLEICHGIRDMGSYRSPVLSHRCYSISIRKADASSPCKQKLSFKSASHILSSWQHVAVLFYLNTYRCCNHKDDIPV